jgi:hypothetical protein
MTYKLVLCVQDRCLVVLNTLKLRVSRKRHKWAWCLPAKGKSRTFVRRNPAEISGLGQYGRTFDIAIENFLVWYTAEFPPRSALSQRELTYAFRTRDLIQRQSVTLIAFEHFTARDFFCLLW